MSPTEADDAVMTDTTPPAEGPGEVSDPALAPDVRQALLEAFQAITPGDRIFIGTGCGEPRFLVDQLVMYVQDHPKKIFDAEVFHIWSLGVVPYADTTYRSNFRPSTFFVGDTTRAMVNSCGADYSPVFLSKIPQLFRQKRIPVDVALIQVSPPDAHGYVSLGVSVDITRAAVESASIVIAQVNPRMPRVHGDTFLHVDTIDHMIPHEEPLAVYDPQVADGIAEDIGRYVARIVQDGDTIQVGYGRIPNAILAALSGKRHLGIHTELFTDGLRELMETGVVDNSMKTVNRGKTIASFCMGTPETYGFIADNPSVEFHPVDRTNDPLTIARHHGMVAINTALSVDLTGQSTVESIGRHFFSGIGGHADFMRGATLAPGGKTILVVESTAKDGTVSRIVPFLPEGSGVTLTRGDIHYVVTEHGVAYLHGKNIRERAMELIAIAHPRFRASLIREAKAAGLIFPDQAFVPGKKGAYPEELERVRMLTDGTTLTIRPVKISDEPLLKDLFYSVSETSMYRRFINRRYDMPHERLQDFVVIDYTREMVLLATAPGPGGETVMGVGQFGIDDTTNTAEVAFIVRDKYQGQGIGRHLLDHLTFIARSRGLHGFTAEVLVENRAMLHVFKTAGFDITTSMESGVYELRMAFVEER